VLKPVEKQVKKMLQRWKEEFPDYRIEQLVVDFEVGGKRFLGTKLRVTLNRVDDNFSGK